jgi:predicted metal-dependent enzyme (double-stranded beta helix superfamily)
VLLHAPRPVRTRFGRSAPTPHGLTDLTALTRSMAAQVHTGAHEVVLVPEHRWYRRLYADPFVDVWLISWATEQATELHDHAGSLGALTVVSGELEEQRWIATERGLRTRRIRAGRGATFDLGHVHDVVNTAPRHAVSVHAYSPPLTATSYYTVDPGGGLVRTRSVLTEGGAA